MNRIRSLPLLILIVGALTIAGCGSSDKKSTASSKTTPAASTPASTTPAGSTGGTVKVSIKNIQFMPKQITAKVGETVVWTNDDGVTHTVTATSGENFDSGQLQAGKTYSYKLDKPGKIHYVCTIHPNQEGDITVTQ